MDETMAALRDVVWKLLEHKANFQDWDASVAPVIPRPSADLDNIRALDPEFSTVLFEDFVYRLSGSSPARRSCSRRPGRRRCSAARPSEGPIFPRSPTPGLDQGWQELVAEDPATDGDALGERVKLIHRELGRAWSALDLSPARPYVSDSLFDYLQYWINAYRQNGVRNVVDDPYLSGWVPARIRRDNHYDALTVRIWAGGKCPGI